MVRIISCIVLFFLAFFPCIAKGEKLDLNVKAEAAILMNADTGAILYEKSAYELHYPASTTKIATALYVLQKAGDKLDEMITADQDSIGVIPEERLRKSNYTLPAYYLIPDGSHIGIKKGETLSLNDLLYGMMIASGDDASNVIAKYVGGTIPQFMDELNVFLKQLGCESTTFYNPHGLHYPKHQTTAYDLAILTKEALKNAKFREIVKTVRYTRPKTNKQEATTLVQGNRLLRQGVYYYPKAIGVKTGYYSLAGNNLVAAAKDGDRTLIAVLLKVKDRRDIFLDAAKMFDTAFRQPKVQRVLLRKGPQKFALEIPGAKKKVATYLRSDVSIEYYPAEEPKVKCLLNWNKELKLPIAKDQQVGDLVIQLEKGHVLRKAPLYAQEEVKQKWFYKIKGEGSWLLKLSAAVLVCLFAGMLFLLFSRGRR